MHRSFTIVPLLIALVLAQAGFGDAPEAGKPNAQMQAVLDELAAIDPKPLEKLTPELARQQPSVVEAVRGLLLKQGRPLTPEPVAAIHDIEVNGAVGNLPARVYTPNGVGPFPVLVYWHGGGWVLANIETYDASCRALCNAAGCIVISCEYRRAPEDRFPAAVDDAFAAYQWVLKNADAVQGNPKNVAVGGESAGGNLAASVALRARESGIGMPVHQLLIYPVTDIDLETTSYRLYADARPLGRTMMQWFFSHYFENETLDPRAFPLQAKEFSRLPATTIITADIDPLRDDGKNYAMALERAGNDIDYRNFEGVTHEFFGMGAVLDASREAVRHAAARLKTSFAEQTIPVGSSTPAPPGSP
jgi:acetyl esterase